MSEILKKPYKITLWEDRNVYIVGQTYYRGDYDNNGLVNAEDKAIFTNYLRNSVVDPTDPLSVLSDFDNDGFLTIVDKGYFNELQRTGIPGEEIYFSQKKDSLLEDDVVQNQYLEEICVATIGSNTMDSPIRAFNPVLTEDLNGSKTFTFQIYSRYWDDKEEIFKDNPFINLLVNERKVKLHYNFEDDLTQGWYDFVIKQVQEDSENYIFTYTCKDLFINELGKTGYSVELETELQNNMGTITQLGNYIVEGTDWQIGDSDLLIQRNKEGLYSYVVTDTITNVKKFQDNSQYGDGEIQPGQVLLVFYSSQANNENPTQFLYKPIGNYSTVDEAINDYYKIDEYGFIVDAENLIANLPNNWEESLYPTNFFGQKIIKKQETHYLPQIEETCSVYTKNGSRYYAYTELDYSSVAEIQSMLSNGSGFISTNGWIGDVALSSVDSDSAIQLSGTVYNTGFYDNRGLLSPNGFTNGEKYVLMVKQSGGTLNNNSYIKLIGNEGTNDTTILTFNTSVDKTAEDSIVSNFDLKNNYSFYTGICNSTINYTSLVRNYGDIRFYLGFSGTLNLIDCKVFKYRLDSNGKLVIPDLQTSANSIIKTRYNFFLESDLEDLGTYYTKQDLNIVQTFLEDETYEDENTHEQKMYLEDYDPIYSSNCEKITSITGSKSNRFNLIQSLCEAFECWAKFTIEHDEMGRILYEYTTFPESEYVIGGRYYERINGETGVSSDDTIFRISDATSYSENLYKKVYHKYINFKEYIGEENPTGFRYGINLKSIRRNIVSDQIATKVIVQPNTNQFAPNGSCTIQQSILNPTGENALYNFQYFINHGLLDITALNNDLYGLNGGLGFISGMKDYNTNLQPYINQLTEISSTLYTLESRQAVYDALMTEAKKMKQDTASECSSAGYSITGTNSVPNYIKDLRDRYKTYSGTLTYYSDLTSRNKNLIEAYRQKYEDVEVILKTIRKKKDKLNSDFENKYYRFIQEGTWTSNDYYDPELYYQAANMVLYTSSFPQISYSINVLELSSVEDFEPYKFKIADKTYIEDTEFFGYDNKGRPYKEEIIISQIKSNLDDPSQNTITVQNYKTQFQDLFQRMAATSQSLQYHEGEYRRAASAINDDGTINSVLMQNTLRDNALIIQNARNQSVTWDETGITISNYLNANEIVRLTSGGIALTTDGGRSWTTGITGNGINADVITAGRIDTDRIRIFNKAMQQTFEWNDKGINAYMTGGSYYDDQGNTQTLTDEINYGTFVRFDKYGLYGYNGGYPSWDPTTINDVINSSVFSLTWKGLSINIPTSGTGAQNMPIITIGPSNDPVFQVDQSGNVTMAGSITLAGDITWSETNKPTSEPLKLYSEVALEKPSGNTTYPSTDTNGTYDIQRYSTSTSIYDWYANGSIISNKYKVYESNNKGIPSSYAIAKIVFEGYTEFKIRIRSYAEGSYDYTIASTLDASTYPQAYNSTYNGSSIVKAHTRSSQSSTTYTSVTYNSSDGVTTGSHFIYIVFRKNASNNSNDDAGYFYIETEQQKTWHTTYNSTKDKYVAYSYDNGATWTTSNAITVDNDTVYKALTNNNGKLGLFYDSTRGLCLNADYIKTGTLNANNIDVTNLKVGNIVDSNGNSITGNTTNTIQGSYLNLDGTSSYNGRFSISDYGYATLYAPTIYAQKFSVLPVGAETIPSWGYDTDAGFSVYGIYGSTLYETFNIQYSGGDAPRTFVWSPCGATVVFGGPTSNGITVTIPSNSRLQFENGSEVTGLYSWGTSIPSSGSSYREKSLYFVYS